MFTYSFVNINNSKIDLNQYVPLRKIRGFFLEGSRPPKTLIWYSVYLFVLTELSIFLFLLFIYVWGLRRFYLLILLANVVPSTVSRIPYCRLEATRFPKLMHENAKVDTRYKVQNIVHTPSLAESGDRTASHRAPARCDAVPLV